MTSVAFLRAVNVGGKTLRVKDLADELGLRSVGAAGTFVGGMAPRALQEAIARRLPFATEVIVCPGAEILVLAAREPFGKAPLPPDTRGHVTMLARDPGKVLHLPIERPAGKPWEIRVVAVSGRYALSLRCRRGPRTLYPNEVVERELGVPATTRNWDTFLAVARLVESAGAGATST